MCNDRDRNTADIRASTASTCTHPNADPHPAQAQTPPQLPDAAASDPAALGWMQGHPGAPEDIAVLEEEYGHLAAEIDALVSEMRRDFK